MAICEIDGKRFETIHRKGQPAIRQLNKVGGTMRWIKLTSPIAGRVMQELGQEPAMAPGFADNCRRATAKPAPVTYENTSAIMRAFTRRADLLNLRDRVTRRASKPEYTRLLLDITDKHSYIRVETKAVLAAMDAEMLHLTTKYNLEPLPEKDNGD